MITILLMGVAFVLGLRAPKLAREIRSQLNALRKAAKRPRKPHPASARAAPAPHVAEQVRSRRG